MLTALLHRILAIQNFYMRNKLLLFVTQVPCPALEKLTVAQQVEVFPVFYKTQILRVHKSRNDPIKVQENTFFLILSFNPPILTQYDTHYRTLWNPVEVLHCSQSHWIQACISYELKKCPFLWLWDHRYQKWRKQALVYFEITYNGHLTKLIQKFISYLTLNNTSLLRIITRFIEKRTHCLLSGTIRNNHTVVGRQCSFLDVKQVAHILLVTYVFSGSASFLFQFFFFIL